jgi:hypothetical protein
LKQKKTEKRKSCKRRKRKRKNESTKSYKDGMKFLDWIINSTLTREVVKYSENKNLLFYINLDR